MGITYTNSTNPVFAKAKANPRIPLPMIALLKLNTDIPIDVVPGLCGKVIHAINDPINYYINKISHIEINSALIHNNTQGFYFLIYPIKLKWLEYGKNKYTLGLRSSHCPF